MPCLLRPSERVEVHALAAALLANHRKLPLELRNSDAFGQNLVRSPLGHVNSGQKISHAACRPTSSGKPVRQRSPQCPDVDADAARLQLLLKLGQRDLRRLGDRAKEKVGLGFADFRLSRRINDTLADMIRARIFAISCGYEDADDLDFLRSDPAFKLARGRLPDTVGLILC